jgi:hypothetical protein
MFWSHLWHPHNTWTLWHGPNESLQKVPMVPTTLKLHKTQQRLTWKDYSLHFWHMNLMVGPHKCCSIISINHIQKTKATIDSFCRDLSRTIKTFFSWYGDLMWFYWLVWPQGCDDCLEKNYSIDFLRRSRHGDHLLFRAFWPHLDQH